MTPKRITKKQVVACVEKWREALHLHDWALRVEVHKMDRAEDGIAHNQAAHEYREAVLRFDPNHVTPENLESVVVHELLHCHVWPLAHVAETLAAGNKKHREWSRVEEEALTTRLERVVLSLTAGASSPVPPTPR